MVKESEAYNNYLDKTTKITDEYANSLRKFFQEEINIPKPIKKSPEKEIMYKFVYVHFKTLDDLYNFCVKINQMISYKVKEIWYLENASEYKLFDTPNKIIVDKTFLEPKKSKKGSNTNTEWKKHWKEMPEFIQENNPPYRSVKVKFKTKEIYDSFVKLLNQNMTQRTKSIWYPEAKASDIFKYRWIQPQNTSYAINPLYIVSKGRWETMYTSKSLSRMKIPHYIVIEPQDYDKYKTAVSNFGIEDYVTLLVAPFSNHGDGPGRARNWAWDHSISIGAESHWVLDDNISDFYRLHQNKRIRVESAVFFRAMEDFVNRYDNIPIAGPNYRFFIASDQKYPPLVFNTRIYSTLLIRNNCKHRWRGRYNEDTDLCLRVLKDGDCTVQFNAFLQDKSTTQRVKGGNTSEFYHSEGNTDKASWKDGYLNAEGTIQKSQMLVDMHPDVAKMVWKYGRWHHHVNYDPFKKNEPRLKDGILLKDEINEYGMVLIDNYKEEK